MYYQCTGKL